MSLRRSARVASSSAPAVSDAKAGNGVAKYEKVAKPATATKKRKTKASTTTDETLKKDIKDAVSESVKSDTGSPGPATPLPKKRKATTTTESPAKPPPFTPTPSGVGLLSRTTELGHPLEDLSQFNARPAEPHTTNATLSTPNGSHVVAYHSSPVKPEDPTPAKKRKAKELVPPDVGTIPSATTDIDLLLKDAEEYLVKVDPKLKPLVEKHHCKIFSPEGLREVVNPFTALCSGIIGQQVRSVVPSFRLERDARKWSGLRLKEQIRFRASGTLSQAWHHSVIHAILRERVVDYIQY
jgi:DNA-3-methyladenine glycosylase II